MGTVMSYALALGPTRPAPAGILAFSGFIPTVDGWEPSFACRQHTRAFVAHGRNDPVIDISFARSARAALQAGGLEVAYHESQVGHHIDPDHVSAAAAWPLWPCWSPPHFSCLAPRFTAPKPPVSSSPVVQAPSISRNAPFGLYPLISPAVAPVSSPAW